MKNLLLVLFIALPLLIFGQDVSVPSVTDSAGLVVILTPIVVFLSIQVVKLIKPITPVWILGLLVPAFSMLSAFLSDIVLEDGTSWLIKFLAGLGSVFVSQLYKQFRETT